MEGALSVLLAFLAALIKAARDAGYAAGWRDAVADVEARQASAAAEARARVEAAGASSKAQGVRPALIEGEF